MADHRLPTLAFHEVPIEEFLTARQQAAAAVKHPALLTPEEVAAGWSEDL